jgi:hypothetical protein
MLTLTPAVSNQQECEVPDLMAPALAQHGQCTCDAEVLLTSDIPKHVVLCTPLGPFPPYLQRPLQSSPA